MAARKPSASNRPRTSKKANQFVTKNGTAIKLHRSLSDRLQAHRDARMARKADVLTNLPRLPDDVEARDARRARVGREQRGQDPHRGRLAGAVRAEQPEDAARLDSEVDTAQRMDVAVALSQPDGLDGGGALHPLYASGRSLERSSASYSDENR